MMEATPEANYLQNTRDLLQKEIETLGEAGVRLQNELYTKSKYMWEELPQLVRTFDDAAALASQLSEVGHSEQQIDENRLRCAVLEKMLDKPYFGSVDFRADGVIVSTPTGSTAYSLSAGGPAIDPTVKCIMLTPVCAHSLYTRPIIFSENTEITIEVVRTEGDIAAYLTVDGEQSITLKKGSRVSIREAEMTADFIVIKKQCFTEILQQKFYNYMQQEDNNE